MKLPFNASHQTATWLLVVLAAASLGSCRKSQFAGSTEKRSTRSAAGGSDALSGGDDTGLTQAKNSRGASTGEGGVIDSTDEAQAGKNGGGTTGDGTGGKKDTDGFPSDDGSGTDDNPGGDEPLPPGGTTPDGKPTDPTTPTTPSDPGTTPDSDKPTTPADPVTPPPGKEPPLTDDEKKIVDKTPGKAVVRVGVNFEDLGFAKGNNDRDHNDAVLCFQGQFKVEGSSVVSVQNQTVSATTSSISDCRHTIRADVVHANGTKTSVSYDSRSTAPVSLSFRVGSKLEVYMTPTKGCDPGVTRTMHQAEHAKVLLDVCNTTGH